MSDDGQAVVEKKGRGRPKANGATKEVKEVKGDVKKRGRPTAAAKPVKDSAKSSDDEQPAAKRGRGRPKGTKKKGGKAKKVSSGGEARGRGRPRKDTPSKAASTEEEQEDEEEEEEEGSDE